MLLVCQPKVWQLNVHGKIVRLDIRQSLVSLSLTRFLSAAKQMPLNVLVVIMSANWVDIKSASFGACLFFGKVPLVPTEVLSWWPS
jgi:hypothetical protein